MRCLFINWKDNTPPSQFTVTPDYTLPRTLGLPRRRRPATLTIMDPTDPRRLELYLDVTQIRSAMVVTLWDDQRVVDTSA